MQKYKYTAVNLENKKIKGTFIANDEKDLAEQLAKQSLYLVSSSIYTGNTPSAFFTLGTGKVTLPELTSFCRQFSIMTNTHIPLLECIDILKNQPFSGYFKKILDVIYDDVKGGMLLSEALEKLEYVISFLGENDGEVAVFNVRLMRLNAVYCADISGIFFAGKQLFTIVCIQFKIINGFAL